jgi:O-antigen ligase
MKWIALAIALVAVNPLSDWLRRNPQKSLKVWMLMGFLPFVIDDFHLYMAVVSWDWGGYIKGAELTILDLVALSLYLSVSGGRYSLPFRLSFGLYFLAALFSAFQAEFPLAALFYSWQLARIFLLFATVTRAVSANPQVAFALLKGMAIALLMEAAVVLWQRFALGVLQTGGTVGHQNTLGLISHLIVFPFFALMLAGRGRLPAAVALAGLIIEVLTTSRATIGLGALGFSLVFALSALRQWTSRKALVLVAGVAMIAILTPLALSSFEQRRSQNDEASSDDERSAYVRAASMMLSDHPLGVGSNHFSLIANLGGYDDKAGVPWDESSRAGNVHNSYWLVLAETGYPGLVALLLLLVRPLPVAFFCGWRHRRDQRGDILLGLGVALLIVYLHSLFEWSLVIVQVQYMLAFTMGSVVGLAENLGYWRTVPEHSLPFAGANRVNSKSDVAGAQITPSDS